MNSVMLVGMSCLLCSPISLRISVPPHTTVAPVSAVDSLSMILAWGGCSIFSKSLLATNMSDRMV